MRVGSNSQHAVAGRNHHALRGVTNAPLRGTKQSLHSQIHEPVRMDYLSAARRSLMHFVSLNVLRSASWRIVPRNDDREIPPLLVITLTRAE